MLATATIAGPADALARLARSRDAEAWGWLLETLGCEIGMIASRLSEDASSADDAVQEALLTIRDHAGSFRPRGQPDADARRWIARVAANAALRVRRTRRRARLHDLRAGAVAEQVTGASHDLERQETAGIVRDALGALGESERTAIVLHVVGGLGYEQVAAELRCPVGTAKTRVHRGLERLRRRLGPRAQSLSLAALVALLAPSASAQEALPPTARELLRSGRRGGAPPPTLIPGASMAIKLGIAAAAVLIAATPLALRAQASADPVQPRSATASTPEARTKAIARQVSLAITGYLAQHPAFPGGAPEAALADGAGGASFLAKEAFAADGSIHDGFGRPFSISVSENAEPRYATSVLVSSSMGTPEDPSDDWALRFTLADGSWREVTGRDAVPAAAAVPTGEPKPSSLSSAAGIPLAEAKVLADSPPVTLTCDRTRAQYIGELLGKFTGVTILVDPSLGALRLHVEYQDMPLVDALEQLAKQVHGRATWSDGAVHIDPLPVPRQEHESPQGQEPAAPREKL